MGTSRSLGRYPALLLASAAAGCAPSVTLDVAPEIVSTEWSRPQSAVANHSPVASSSFAEATAAGALDLQSPQLARLLAQAAEANADIAIAQARIRQSRALLRTARSAMLPTVSASAGANGTRTGSNPFDFSGAFGGIDMAFDLDLFGEARAGRNAAADRYRAAIFDREAAALVVQADVARAFVQQAALADRMVLLDRNITAAEELERVIRVRMEAGAANRVDLGLQAIQLRRLRADRIRLLEAQDRTVHALAVLVGEEAPRFAPAPASLSDLAIPDMALSQPAELVTRRPDMRAAEARIAAAGGDVTQARAAFFPHISLSAGALGQAATLGGPIGLTMSIGADLLAPIFNRGRLRGNLDFAAGTQAESVAQYRRTLLSALAETEDALSGVERSRARELLLLEIVEEARLTARLARLQYLEGEVDLQWVLDAEGLLVEAEDARAVVLQERIEAAIDLFKAMGGSPRA